MDEPVPLRLIEPPKARPVGTPLLSELAKAALAGLLAQAPPAPRGDPADTATARPPSGRGDQVQLLREK